MLERLLDVEQVDHEWRDRDNALVDGGGGPGGPAALRSTRDEELIDVHVAAFLAVAERRDGVYGPHGALRHRQTQRPFLIAGPHVLVPGVGDNRVLTAGFGLTGERDRLIGDVLKHAGDRAGGQCERSEDGVGSRGRLAADVAAGNEEESDIGLDRLGLDNDQPVLPDGVIDLGGGQVLLRGEIDDVGGVTVTRDGVDQLPFVVRIGCGDVFIECCRVLRGGKGENEGARKEGDAERGKETR